MSTEATATPMAAARVSSAPTTGPMVEKPSSWPGPDPLENGSDQRVLGLNVQGRGADQGPAVFGQLDGRARVAAVNGDDLDGLLSDVLVEAELDQRTAGEVDAGFESAGEQCDNAGQQQRQRQQVPPAAAGGDGKHQVSDLVEAPAPKRRGWVRTGQVMARRSRFRLTVMALNMLTATPMASVTAKPRTPPLLEAEEHGRR